ncbi:conserved hypothetical protein [Candidatus Competibacter denitrificans Run_A_D11]|uniref:Phage portal protein n=1 Tax=Candidatus Competibacter denitrificans Run_A_D11 TaxID=1400863 RepID=W6M991_9GAMM|nr:conserved hypothetical protein [Candidatus Competibacter denitrificans Run_A_D11]HAS87206.1 hypothetical protein [Candidatus Competibacteraceae bacterium]
MIRVANTGPDFKFIADALNSTGGFADGTYLVAYPRELADKIKSRRELAWYDNALKPACQRFVGYLLKRPAFRDTQNEALAGFIASCNWQDDSLDVFLSGFMVDAKARGSMLLLVDMPTQQQILDGLRTLPYLVPIYPEAIKTYRLNPRGQLAAVVFTDQVQDKDGRWVAVERTYTETGWQFTGGETGSGTHPLGVCPVLAFTESGLFPSLGEFAAIAVLSKRLYNLRSELDEILRAQTFSLLMLRVPEARFPLADLKEVAQGIGTGNILQAYQDGAEFIAPPSGPANTYLDVIAQVEGLIRKAALIVDIPNSNSQESGVALQLRFQALNSSLVHFARRMEDFERKIWWLVKAWLNLHEAEIAIAWGKDFSIADLATEMEIAQNMAALNAPPAYTRAKLKQLVQLDLGALPGDEISDILNAIDEMGLAPPDDPSLPADLPA